VRLADELLRIALEKYPPAQAGAVCSDPSKMALLLEAFQQTCGGSAATLAATREAQIEGASRQFLMPSINITVQAGATLIVNPARPTK
jgi:hypothetical protein